MGKEWKYFLILTWFSYLLVSGVLLFARGFLLNREVQPEKSVCMSSLDSFCESHTHNLYTQHGSVLESDSFTHIPVCSSDHGFGTKISQTSKKCLPSKARVILIIIDALKYDFALYDDKLKKKNAKPYQNKLTIFKDLLHNYKNHSRLFKFIADPPTTTMQRLKGLTTGSLPTFIDVGSNFASSEIDEDNIIDQVASNKKNIVFMGDDTWTGLYPKRFLRQYPYPSFDVWDLDTVDKGIMNHLLPEMRKKDWSLLIAHFLGVDHCGHRYGPEHPEMSRKLLEMNSVIRNVCNALDANTVLFVIGDHGMTTTGDHGGDSEAEVTSAMFVYSKKPLMFGTNVVDSVSQVDLVPTLSTILGVPIPFSNLGNIILDALPVFSEKNIFENEDWNFALRAVWNNVEQTTRYIHKYSSRNSKQFSKQKILSLNESYASLKKALTSVSNEETIRTFIHRCSSYVKLLREMCQEVWVEFNFSTMLLSLALMFLSLILLVSLIIYAQQNDIYSMFQTKNLKSVATVIILAPVTSSILTILCVLDYVDVSYTSISFIAMIPFLFSVTRNWFPITKQSQKKHLMALAKPINICSLTALFCTSFAFFSNSYVINEAKVLSYFIVTVLLLHFYAYLKTKEMEPSSKGKAVEKSVTGLFKLYLTLPKLKCGVFVLSFAITVRLTHYYWVCREGHANCVSFVSRKPQASDQSHSQLERFITLVFLGILVTVARIWLRACGNLVGFSPVVTLARYAPTITVVFIGGFWVVQDLPSVTRDKIILPWHLNFLPWTVYSLVFVAYICIFVQPLCVFTLLNKKNEFVLPVYGQRNVIPRLYNQMKELIRNKKTNDTSEDAPVVCGLATAYSASVVVAVLFIILFAAILLGMFAQALVLMSVCSVCLLVVLTVVHNSSSLFSGRLFIVPWSSVLCWVFLPAYFFYATGHQPTFPAIHWEAAFIGTGGVLYSRFISAGLVIVNTFAPHMAAGIGLPSLLIIPFTLKVMFPKLVPTKSKGDDNKKGEMIIFQKDNLFYDGLFDLCLKYILLSALRVFGCMLTAAIHCRHLMVWSIFAPKFIFESIAFFVTVPSVLVGYLLMVRVTHCIEKFINELDEQFR